MTDFRCGLVALVGKPNVGKSTILNRLVGQKVSITSRRPQTTRHRILGIKSDDSAQIVFVDTPGLHARQPRAMNRYLNRAAADSLRDVDVVVLVVEGTRWGEDDEWVLERLTGMSCPAIVAINKIDKVADKGALLPYLDALAGKREFAALIPVCARSGAQLDELEAQVRSLLPVAPALFPEDQVTDRSERFLAAELVREKLFRKLGEEIPYGLTVEIERFREEQGVLHIHALVWVDKSRHKAMVIGAKGQLLKAVGREARQDMETAFGHKVFLQIWVKVKEGWADDERALQSLGYRDEG
jgi:GTP-binding protein Era